MSKDVQSTEDKGFSLTESAAKRITELLKKEDDRNARLRVSVDGGGCSGFQYNFGFDSAENNDDTVIEKSGAQVVVDNVSMEFLSGSVLDYVDTLGASHFEVKNPNAKASCGCGNSFSV